MKQLYFRIKSSIILLLPLLLMTCLVSGQQNSNPVKGEVKNQKGEALQGVTVTIQNKDSAVIATSVTDASGTFIVNSLQPGN